MAQKAITPEKLLEDWNSVFPHYQLTLADLKKPHTVMGALFQVFKRLGIDEDALLAPPPEESRNENTIYYWDLLPVINMTRVIKYLFAFIPRMDITVSITHFLQPTVATSHSILLLLMNLTAFNENRLGDIQPHEEVLFSKMDQVKYLEDRKNKLLEMLNEQAEKKGKRAEQLEMLGIEIKQFEEELKIEKDAHDEKQQEFEAILKENKQIDIALEQKKGHKDSLIAEIEKKQALRVYDAEDIRAQEKQAAQNVQEAEEKLKSLRETLMQKENSLKNLQTIKPNLDAANNLLHEITKLSVSLRDYENGDLDSDSMEGELDVLKTELGELEVQLAEISAAREAAAKSIHEADNKRRQEKTLAETNLRDTEEKDKKCKERCNKLIQRTQQIKELTSTYMQEKAEGMEKLASIQESFTSEIKSMDETLMKKTIEARKKIEEKIKNISI
ncbi:uncharacterized protein [Epargyreus clarus]|uniref:uncharacterized protein n=1 Tax=Epargyreus clarus TaxID=520877 RepID=UPI003C2D5C01